MAGRPSLAETPWSTAHSGDTAEDRRGDSLAAPRIKPAARPSRDEVTQRVRAVARPSLVDGGRSRTRFVALAVVGVAGAAIGVWLAMSDTLLVAEPPRATASADVVPSASVAGDLPAQRPTGRPDTSAPDPAEQPAERGALVPPALAATESVAVPVAEPGPAPSAPDPATLTSEPAAATRPATGRPGAKLPAGRAGVKPPAIEAAGQRLAKRQPADGASAAKNRPGKTVVQQDQRAKTAKPKVRVDARRPAKPPPKEQPWNNDSPFMPVTTPKR